MGGSAGDLDVIRQVGLGPGPEHLLPVAAAVHIMQAHRPQLLHAGDGEGRCRHHSLKRVDRNATCINRSSGPSQHTMERLLDEGRVTAEIVLADAGTTVSMGLTTIPLAHD